MHLTEQTSKAKVGHRQAGVSCAACSSDESEPAALSFSSHQDALDFVARSLEEIDRTFAARDLNVLNRYCKGDVGIYVGLASRRTHCKFDLSFFRVPSDPCPAGANDLHAGCFANDRGCVENGRLLDGYGFDREVFCRVSDVVYGPESVISSFVCLELFENRADFRRQILAATGQVVPPFLLGRANRELDVLKLSAFAELRGNVSELIEDGPEIVCGVKQNALENLRGRFSEDDFMRLVAGIGIAIRPEAPWVTINKLVQDAYEVIDVVVSARESQARALECI